MPLTPTPSPASPTFVPAIDIKQQTDSNHDTALSVAAAGGHDDLVKLLLQRGSELEHRDKKGSLEGRCSFLYSILALVVLCKPEDVAYRAVKMDF